MTSRHYLVVLAVVGATAAPAAAGMPLFLAGAAPPPKDPKPVWSAKFAVNDKDVCSITAVGFSPDGRFLLTTAATRSDRWSEKTGSAVVRAWDSTTGKERFRHDLGPSHDWSLRLPGLAFPSTKRVLAAGRNVDLLDLDSGRRVGETLRSSAPAAGVWALKDAAEFLVLNCTEAPVLRERRSKLVLTHRAVAPDGEYRALGEPSVLLPVNGDAEVDCAAVSRDGTKLATAETGTVSPPVLRVFQVGRPGQVALTPVARADSPHKGQVFATEFNPDGTVLATGGADCLLKLWDLPPKAGTWGPRATVRGPKFSISCISFRPDGKVLAFGSFDVRTPSLWVVDVASGRVLTAFRTAGQVTAVGFSPDGKRLATGSAAADASKSVTVQVWDAEGILQGK